jgi:nucleotide-binding universal stress UspA family protein
MIPELKDILVPVDFQESSMRATEYAVQLANESQGKIHFLYVIRKLDYFSELMRSVADIEKISAFAKEKLKELAEKFEKEKGIRCETHVVHGKVHEETEKKASEINASFIVIGDNQQNESESQSVGSNMAHIISHATCPVLVTKYPVRHVFNKIVVPLDLSTETSRQIKNAIILAKKYDASLHLVSALIAGMKHKKSRIFKKMEEIQKTLNENNIECTSKLYPKSETPPYKSVLEYAYEIQADSILVMTHQEKRGDNYIGAFAQNLIIESKIPVLSLTASAGDSENAEAVQKFIDPFGIIFGSVQKDEKEQQ